MRQMVDMITRAVEGYQNADPKTQKIFFWTFVILVALTIAEQVYL
jgi:hypothetical protein